MLTLRHFIQLILDFLHEVVQKPTVLIGNSVGSLACVIAASGRWLSFFFFSFRVNFYLQGKSFYLPLFFKKKKKKRNVYLREFMKKKSSHLILSATRITSIFGSRACAVELCWWHEQQGNC